MEIPQDLYLSNRSQEFVSESQEGFQSEDIEVVDDLYFSSQSNDSNHFTIHKQNQQSQKQLVPNLQFETSLNRQKKFNFPSFENLKVQSQQQQQFDFQNERPLISEQNMQNESMFSITDTNENTLRQKSLADTEKSLKDEQQKYINFYRNSLDSSVRSSVKLTQDGFISEQLQQAKRDLQRVQSENNEIKFRLSNHNDNIVVKDYLINPSFNSSTKKGDVFGNEEYLVSPSPNFEIKQKSSLDNLQINLIQKEKELHQYKIQFESQQSEFQSVIDEKNKAFQAEKEVSRKLKKGLESSIEEIQKLQQKFSLLEKEKNNLNSKIQQQTSKINQAQQENQEQKQIIDKLQEQKNQMQQKLQKTEKQLENFQSLSNQSSIDNLKQDILQKERKLTQASEKLKELEVRVHSLTNNVSSLETSLKEKDKLILLMQNSHKNEIKILQQKIDLTKDQKLQENRPLQNNSTYRQSNNIQNESIKVQSTQCSPDIQNQVSAILKEFVQFFSDYRSSKIFPNSRDNHSQQFINQVFSIFEVQSQYTQTQNVQTKLSQIQNFLQILLTEFEYIIGVLTVPKKDEDVVIELSQETQSLDKQDKSNLDVIVKDKFIEVLRNEISLLNEKNQILQNKLSEIEDNAYDQKQNSFKQKQNIKTQQSDVKEYYRKLIEVLLLYFPNPEIQQMVNQLLDMRDSYELKQKDLHMHQIHLEDLEEEFKVISFKGNNNESQISQMLKMIDNHKIELNKVKEQISILIKRISERVILIKQLAFQENQKCQQILRSQSDHLRLKQQSEEYQYKIKNLEMEIKMFQQATSTGNKENIRSLNQPYLIYDQSRNSSKKLAGERDTGKIDSIYSQETFGVERRTRTQSANNSSLHWISSQDNLNAIKVMGQKSNITLRERGSDQLYQMSIRDKINKYRGGSIGQQD